MNEPSPAATRVASPRNERQGVPQASSDDGGFALAAQEGGREHTGADSSTRSVSRVVQSTEDGTNGADSISKRGKANGGASYAQDPGSETSEVDEASAGQAEQRHSSREDEDSDSGLRRRIRHVVA